MAHHHLANVQAAIFQAQHSRGLRELFQAAGWWKMQQGTWSGSQLQAHMRLPPRLPNWATCCTCLESLLHFYQAD